MRFSRASRSEILRYFLRRTGTYWRRVFFPFPFVPCFLRSKTHRNRGVAGFSEKSLSRVSLLPTGIIFPRNDKSTVERSLRLEVDLDRIFDFSSAAKPRTLINACRVDSKNVLDYLNIFFLRCFRVVRTQ